MSKFWDVMRPHLERIASESSEQVSIEAKRAQTEIYSKLINEGWAEESPQNAPVSYASIENQPGIEADNSLYEDVWGEAPTAEDVYGASSFEYGEELPELPDPSEAYEYEPDIEPEC